MLIGEGNALSLLQKIAMIEPTRERRAPLDRDTRLPEDSRAESCPVDQTPATGFFDFNLPNVEKIPVEGGGFAYPPSQSDADLPWG